MPSDYEEVTKDNVRRRGTDFDDIGRLISEQFYTDRTHFVYELLQNAEDALRRRFRDESQSRLPCRVQFRLRPDRLEFKHFGRLFDFEDVCGITDILRGTKSGDRSQIGKFGIGFKSVYAFTSAPEVHSGDEHFVIERYIRPRKLVRIPKLERGETSFVLPFNHDRVPPEEAHSLISKRLNNIGVRTLLFLRHIDEIEWQADNGVNGKYLKEEEVSGDAKQITIMGQSNGVAESEEWLLFERPIPLPESDGEAKVELAFRVENDVKTGNRSIVRTRPSPLTVYFPTEVETRCGFLAQGPYVTTPARDNIPKEDGWNKTLIGETAILISESLSTIKRMGFLDVTFLGALPIRSEDFPADGIFRPIYDAVLAAFHERRLLPTDRSSFVSTQQAKLARGADLRRLLNGGQLQQLYSSDKAFQWLSGEITEIRPPDLWDYLTDELGIDIVNPDAFARRITTLFLEKQPDQWVSQLYGYLLSHEELWRRARYSGDHHGPLRNKEIIRLNDGMHVKPFRSDGQPNAFLPTEGLSGYSMVNTSIARNERSLAFLRKLGLREVGEREFIEGILSSYYVENAPDPSQNEHIKHMKRFVAWHQKTGDKKVFDGCFLFQDNNMQDYHNAEGCFLDAPLKDTSLSCLFESNPKTNPNLDRVSIWEGYRHIAGFNEFAVSLGVMDELRIVPRSSFGNPETARLHVDYYRARQTLNKIDEDYSIDNLDDLLSRKDINISKLIWNTVRRADPKVLKARYRPNRQYDTQVADSSLVHTLRSKDWIPDRNGAFLLPVDVSEGMLPDEFIYDDRNGWLRAIGFGSDVEARVDAREEKRRHAEALGIRNLELIEIMKEVEENPGLLARIRSVIDTEKRSAAFPVHQSQNPERRESRVADDIQGAPNKTYEKRERRTRISLPARQEREIFLRESYTNPDSQMVCQICKQEMPFKKRDGNYYFEALELISDLDREHEALFVALCPLCAAMFKEFVKLDADSMGALQRSIISSQQPEIPICLGQLKTTIRFVETHFLDLRTIVKELSGSS